MRTSKNTAGRLPPILPAFPVPGEETQMTFIIDLSQNEGRRSTGEHRRNCAGVDRYDVSREYSRLNCTISLVTDAGNDRSMFIVYAIDILFNVSYNIPEIVIGTSRGHQRERGY